MPGFIGVFRRKPGAERQSANFLERSGEAVGITRELDSRRVREKFTLSRDCTLNEPAKKRADRTHNDQDEADDRKRILLTARTQQDFADNRQAKDAKHPAD